MKLKPLYDRIVVQKIDPPKITKGGLHLPETAEDYKITTAKVLAVGKGALLATGQHHPLTTQVGDTVLFQRYSGQEVRFEGEDYIVIKESDVIGIIPPIK